MTKLRGITWEHTRGYAPMVATAQRFSELHSEFAIQWEKRSLKQFGDLALDQLIEQFDFLVIDHPFVRTVAAQQMLLPLEQHLPASFLADQAAHSVGLSNTSYIYSGNQLALAIDASAPISGWRLDLMEKADASVPSTWVEVLALARRGLVAIPGAQIDTLMHLYMLCVGLGEAPLSRPDMFASHNVGVKALQMLRELAGLVSPDCSVRNPIQTWELIAKEETVAYCPFAYGYSNYSRQGYAEHWIDVGGLPSLEGPVRFRSTLGGAGLAISVHSRHIKTAVEYCRFVADANCQKHLYFDAGGQPGYRSAWQDEEVNRRCHGFFRKTLQTLDEAWLRPCWNGYHQFQAQAATVVHPYIWGGGDAGAVLSTLNGIAREMCHAEGRA